MLWKIVLMKKSHMLHVQRLAKDIFGCLSIMEMCVMCMSVYFTRHDEESIRMRGPGGLFSQLIMESWGESLLD